MSMEIACECEHVPGIGSHSHVYEQRVETDTVDLDGMTTTRRRAVMVEDPYDVRPWVNWKAIAKELARG